MKRVLLIILSLLLLTTLSACSVKKQNNVEQKQTASQPKENKTIIYKTKPVKLQFKKLTFSSEKTYEGKTVSDDIFKDYDLTLVNIWGTFCKPCINEMPSLQELSEELKKKNIQVVGIVFDGEKEKEALDIIMKKTGIYFTNIIADEKLRNLLGTNLFPTNILVDSEGNVIDSRAGAIPKENYMEFIEDGLKKIK